MARLFFAIWPELAAARELAQVGESLAELAGGKPQPVEKIHMTLAFLGALDAEKSAAAFAAAARIRSAEVRMTVDRVGSFRRSKVGWAAPAQEVESLAQLQSTLASELRQRGFTLEDRAFTPHITLVRKLAHPVPRAPMPAIEWRSRALTLVETTGDGRYEIRESWELRAV
jgi:2'-5' RNA ligase